uniref:Uncharacterized protein n=1 Tax=Dendroctonus ponderosae TaxID=77166 RepID=A0AAR5PA59_DENPD
MRLFGRSTCPDHTENPLHFRERKKMSGEALIIIVVVVVVLKTILISLIIRKKCRQVKEQRDAQRFRSQANQTTGNISGHVPGQNAPPYPDAYLSIEHIIVENELNKSQKCTEAPPSYEEAMRLALAHSNSLQTYEVEQRSANQQLGANQATSSATPIAPTHQPTALPLERF